MGIRPAPKGDRTLYAEVGIWYDANLKEIHVTCPSDPDGKFHIRLRNQPGSTAHHEAAYNHFKRLLQMHGRWPTDVP